MKKCQKNMKNKFWKKTFFEISKAPWKVSVMMPKHSPMVAGWIWEKVENLNFWGPEPLGCIWMLYVCSGDMVCALETWYVLYGHAICLLGIEYAVCLLGIEYAVWTCYMSSGDRYAVWTCYMSSGDGICCMDMVYAFFTWNIFSWYGIYFLDMM